MAVTYRAERAESPSNGSVSWMVVDDTYDLHVAGCAFLAGLRGRDRSINTERLYAGRVALFLSWCVAEGVDWRAVRLDQMVRFKRWLVTEPLPSRRRTDPGPGRYRSESTADAVLGTVCEFFRFCGRHDLMEPGVGEKAVRAAVSAVPATRLPSGRGRAVPRGALTGVEVRGSGAAV